jgi:hypothetical protein
MTDRDVARWRNSCEWLNGGECCGDKDSDGICAAPACIFGEAVKELQLAADRIEELKDAVLGCFDRINDLQAALREIINKDTFSMDWAIRTARKALEGKDE